VIPITVYRSQSLFFSVIYGVLSELLATLKILCIGGTFPLAPVAFDIFNFSFLSEQKVKLRK